MSKKQTAVEFLVEQITKHTWYDEEGFGHVSVSILDIEQAKQIERQQHGNTWDAAIKAHNDRGHVHARSLTDFDDYEVGS